MIWKQNVRTDSRKTYHKKRFWAGILLAQAVLFYLLSKSDRMVSLFERFFAWQKDVHQRIFAGAGFSVGDALYITLVIAFGLILYGLGRRRLRNRSVLSLLILLNLLYFTYHIWWGMLYFQKPISDQLPEVEITDEKLKKLALRYLELSRESKLEVKEDRNGVFKIYDPVKIQHTIVKFQNEGVLYNMVNNGDSVLSFKPSLFSRIISYTGIQGYYNPFTAEAQYNPELPSTYLPFTLAHEHAHQTGFAREQEANFIAFLTGKHSGDPNLRYSTYYYVLKSLLNALVESDPEFVKEVLRNYSPGMKRDRMAELMFRKKHEGWLEEFFGMTNDLFLKSNRQDGAVTYSYFVNLLVRYEETNALKR
ncbi:DUF3810 domain-containing protein [Kaistella sp. PBT33-4]|uniref:DUF3810 domain-containing protein n=1 Tax=Kaistella sp. PBT33-4 TaxID=3032000 RepID=UPI0023D8938C|nr:DUF3810 domain-containing protein [Kaistella sp. PBT33-4]MDF0720911.1 DUF3810 domain-containing protein [Kaistella sp. PBT33-4]